MSEQVLTTQVTQATQEQSQPGKPKARKPIHFNRKNLIALGGVLLIAAAAIILLLNGPMGAPVLSLQPPQSIPASSRDEFVVDVTLSAMEDNLYPAASLIVEFDKNRLEFTGVKMGNVMAYENFNPVGNDTVDPPMMIPTWSCNTELSNQSGEIRAMYLDMTGGNNAYAPAGFDSNGQNIVLRLGFKLKDSAGAGGKIAVSLVDAVFATSGGDVDKTSMSTSRDLNTLRAKDAEIIVK